uniref:Phospholipid methyltransferase n=1 Tax=Coralloluteibacterium stylophorae TaxID=1776034 RepID=A0A8J7VV04_9GAMM
MNEQLSFLCNRVIAPRRVAAIAPSSRALAALITRGISAADAPVLELGAGTGVFTRRLVAVGVPQDQLVLVESGPGFARRLRHEFPSSRVLQMDAARLGGLDLFAGTGAGAVVSGLPLLSMSSLQVARILKGAFSQLRDGGAFYQFTYGPGCPVPRAVLERYGLRARLVGRTFANLPPAAVFRISRKAVATRLF